MDKFTITLDEYDEDALKRAEDTMKEASRMFCLLDLPTMGHAVHERAVAVNRVRGLIATARRRAKEEAK